MSVYTGVHMCAWLHVLVLAHTYACVHVWSTPCRKPGSLLSSLTQNHRESLRPSPTLKLQPEHRRILIWTET